MGLGGPHDMHPMGPSNMNQGPPSMGTGLPMMQNFGQGDGPPNQGMMPPGGGTPGSNFYDNFYQQQQAMSIDGSGRDGELILYFNFSSFIQINFNQYMHCLRVGLMSLLLLTPCCTI